MFDTVIRHFMSNFILNPLLTASDYVCSVKKRKRDVGVILVKVESDSNDAFLVNALSIE